MKYKGIWEGYEATYKARPLAMEVAHQREAVEGARRKGAVGVACGQGARAGLSGQTQVSLRVVARDGFDTYRWSTGHVYACCHLSSESE